MFLWNVFCVTDIKLNYLEWLWIKIDEDMLSKKQISRYEAVRYLNYAQCFDCMLPPENKKQELNNNWFTEFKKKDSVYLSDIYHENDYYYCITNLAKIDYIHGFPYTNPICWWQFCWSNSFSFWELFQIIVNIISKDIYSKYTIKDIDNFYENILKIKNTQDAKQINITNSEYDLAENLHKNYDWSYIISNFNEFFLYQKYCNLYPQECSFKNFWNIQGWHYALSLLNILYNEWLISALEWINFDPWKKVSWQDLINWLYKIKNIKNCKIDNDYDKDWILNKDDNCIYNYNPNQKDTDKDNIWDVYDEDIDGDGIKNPIWIVDDDGNIIISKITKDTDNCIFVKNKDQKDIDKDSIWDACEDENYKIVWIWINCSSLKWNAPLKINCNAEIKWYVKEIVWTYKWEIIWKWKSINYTFKTSWEKVLNVTAIWKNNDTSNATAYFKVWEKSINNLFNLWIQIFANPTSWPEWTKIVFGSQTVWEKFFIKWDLGDGTKYDKKPDSNFSKIYNKAWIYKVIATLYKDNKVVWVSYLYIKIYEKNDKDKSSLPYLKAEPLIWYINQPITFTLQQVTENDIENIIWDFWDEITKTTNSISTEHAYNKSWSYGVKASIYTKEWKIIDNFITEKIIDIPDNKTDKAFGALLKADTLEQQIWKEIKFTILPDGFTENDIDKVIWNFWDNVIEKKQTLKNNHTYYKNWSKTITANIILKNKENIIVSLTESIYWQDICLNWLKQLKCDMDKDGIKDICDEDIDGDWINNLLWIIKFEDKNCYITNKNIDTKKLSDKNWQNTDNCPFIQNNDQIDVNSNGVWDACEINIGNPYNKEDCVWDACNINPNDIDTGNCVWDACNINPNDIDTGNCVWDACKIDPNDIDTDNDGVYDKEDHCIDIPENIDSIEDEDWCPEIPDINNDFFLNVENCATCPCHFADYASPFMYGLNLKALLVNPYNSSIIYKISENKK